MRFLMTAFVLLGLQLSVNTQQTCADDLQIEGEVLFVNIQETLKFEGASSSYFAEGTSPQLGRVFQTGSILPTSAPVPVDGGLQFEGVQGPHPIPGQGNIHIIHAKGGKIFCTWKAVFTITFVNADGDAIFSGDGDFTIVGGTGVYRNATGTFQTLFETDVVPAGSDTADALYTQDGEIN